METHYSIPTWKIQRSLAGHRPRTDESDITDHTQTSQVKDFSAFLFMGRCKSLGSLKSFLYLGPMSCAFHTLSSSGLPVGNGYIQADGCHVTQVFSFLDALEGWNPWRRWHPCSLRWQEILCFSVLKHLKTKFEEFGGFLLFSEHLCFLAICLASKANRAIISTIT